MPCVTFRFYEELNDFLAPARRRQDFDVQVPDAASVKHAIEALGVPHTEVELILVNGVSAGFDHRLQDGDRVSVYPMFEAMDITPLLRLRAAPLRATRFFADAHLGGLARLLRLAGFDTRYANHVADAQIEEIARREHRVVLTRDRDLLMRRNITHGCYVRALRPREQLREVFERLHLARAARPFTCCLVCNTPLRPVGREEALARLPENVTGTFDRFSKCETCDRLFWEGSHWRRMRLIVEPLLA